VANCGNRSGGRGLARGLIRLHFAVPVDIHLHDWRTENRASTGMADCCGHRFRGRDARPVAAMIASRGKPSTRRRTRSFGRSSGGGPAPAARQKAPATPRATPQRLIGPRGMRKRLASRRMRQPRTATRTARSDSVSRRVERVLTTRATSARAAPSTRSIHVLYTSYTRHALQWRSLPFVRGDPASCL
jgi:hypothetical protein